MAHDVFISYSSEDKAAADAVCAILESNGVRCWIAPRDIMPGADWGESIVRSIRECRLLLLVFSTSANKSKQIKREIEVAADGGVTIVPLRIENIAPTESFKYFLGNIHWMDALTPPLERHLQIVAEKVKAILATDLSRNSPEKASEAVSEERQSTSAPALPSDASKGMLLRPPIIIGFMALLAAIGAAFLIGWPRTTAGVGMEDNTDRMGSDYRNFDLSRPDPALCQATCNAETRCKSWAYVKPGVQGPSGRCWLKDNAPNAVANPCCISGTRTSTASVSFGGEERQLHIKDSRKYLDAAFSTVVDGGDTVRSGSDLVGSHRKQQR
ncbi:TIR domain-containing protein [Variovorax sp. GT1P44]|uniref:TIR domain-containing protein n=1 Tax=Variovorax sp. GT1P44 TaxID=3443742 RepID=UPI003F47E72E